MLSWLVALAYTLFGVQWLSLRFVYPRLWSGCTRIRQTAGAELRHHALFLKAAHLLTTAIPLVGAVLLIAVGPRDWDLEQYALFRISVMALVGIGLAGTFFSFRATKDLSGILATLTGRNPFSER
jgi:hypothetical protein